jgi:hypothetical protein
MDIGGEGIFCLLEHGLKFKKFNGSVFMVITYGILHCTIKNAIGVPYGITFFS